MEDEEHKPSWKFCVGIGIVNLILVFLATNFRIVFLSEGLVIFIIIGIIGSGTFIVQDWKAGFKRSAIGCLVGLVLNGIACEIYVSTILMTLIAQITRLFVK